MSVHENLTKTLEVVHVTNSDQAKCQGQIPCNKNKQKNTATFVLMVSIKFHENLIKFVVVSVAKLVSRADNLQ